MTDLKDARAKIRAAAGRMLARKETFERDLERIEADRKKVMTELEGVLGHPELEAGYRELLTELNAQVEQLQQDIAVADQDQKAALQEMDALGGLEGDALRGAVVQATRGDDAIDAALERVRAHGAGLDAEARLGTEPRHVETESPEAKARRQLAELKARRDGTGASEGGDVSEADPSSRGKPKKTL